MEAQRRAGLTMRGNNPGSNMQEYSFVAQFIIIIMI